MLEFIDPLLFWGVLALQIIGVASVVFARLPRQCPIQACCRTLFVGCLVFVGMATMAAISVQSGCWAWCGITFSIMAVGATFDRGVPVRATAY
jgi:hypothetical protein